MIPIKDDIPSSHFPVVTLIIIGLNLLVFAFQFVLRRYNQWLISAFGVIPYELSHFKDLPPYLPFPLPSTLFTAMFLHGGVAHIFGNMLYLWIFGDNVEDAMGHIRFIIFYLSCGVVAAITQIIISPHSTVPMIGASGAISGVLGAYLLLYPRAKVLTLVFFGFFLEMIRIPAVVLLSIWIIIQFASGVISLSAHSISGGIAWFAHIGGFLAGMAFISFFKKSNRKIRHKEIWSL